MDFLKKPYQKKISHQIQGRIDLSNLQNMKINPNINIPLAGQLQRPQKPTITTEQQAWDEQILQGLQIPTIASSASPISQVPAQSYDFQEDFNKFYKTNPYLIWNKFFGNNLMDMGFMNEFFSFLNNYRKNRWGK